MGRSCSWKRFTAEQDGPRSAGSPGRPDARGSSRCPARIRSWMLWGRSPSGRGGTRGFRRRAGSQGPARCWSGLRPCTTTRRPGCAGWAGRNWHTRLSSSPRRSDSIWMSRRRRGGFTPRLGTAWAIPLPLAVRQGSRGGAVAEWSRSRQRPALGPSSWFAGDRRRARVRGRVPRLLRGG